MGAETRAEEKIGGDNERYNIYQVLFLARSSVRFHGCNVLILPYLQESLSLPASDKHSNRS